MYISGSQTADMGAGLVWDDVYVALEPHRVNAVGGRTTGVGVAGLTLGGGLFKSHHMHKELIICRRIFMENVLIRFGSRHGDCI
jgi:hypothetical protein